MLKFVCLSAVVLLSYRGSLRVGKPWKSRGGFQIPPGFERCGAKFLTLPGYHSEMEELLGSARDGDHVYVRAYSLDSRPLVAAGAQVRVAKGTSVKAAYAAENRTEVFVSSRNSAVRASASSRANAEVGVALTRVLMSDFSTLAGFLWQRMEQGS